ncbi:MAG TPA: type II toxin-antitoxin system RelE/ParE family toxin [Gemmatimonadaceae bacterium]|nr:type II toxin-antitoxin system RelE/ParE family toxin [Gemmatimonadaceae bacterium]
MASYSVLIKASAAKELERIPDKPRAQIVRRIQALSDDPRPMGCEKLSGDELYRIRQGDYRVVYAIADAELTVLVVRVRHRRDVYR